MADIITEIDSIGFGLYTAEEIRAMSVCLVDSTKMEGSGTVYDERMGSNLEINKDCVTCELSAEKCPGHFGHMELNHLVVNPLFFKMVTSYLRCFCVSNKCNDLLVTAEQIKLWGFSKAERERKFDKIIEHIKKIDICNTCGQPQPKIMYSPTDNIISMVYKQKKNKVSIPITTEEIKKVFDNVTDEQVRLLGFDPDLIHPRSYIISAMLVIPPCARPFVKADGTMCDDDLTNQYLEIIKSNNHLRPDNPDMDEAKRTRHINTLKFRIATLFNNSQGKAKHTTNSRPIKGIKERIVGKDGQVRTNLMGKRVEQSGRTVIGPNPHLKLGEVGVPHQIAENLTYPERVASYNIDHLTAIVNEGKANFVRKPGGAVINLMYARCHKGTRLLYGDGIIRREVPYEEGDEEKSDFRNAKVLRDGVYSTYEDCTPLTDGDVIVFCSFEVNGNLTLKQGDRVIRNGALMKKIDYPSINRINLSIGDVVDRHLQNGDIVLMNRQPTLHKGSMLAKRVVRVNAKTFQLNLATTKSFNAD
jgi:DNA-directed RNA polymerase beta' subunit